MKLICSNGMKVRRNKSLIDSISHLTATSFYRGIVENIMSFDEQFIKRFEENTTLTFDLPKAPPPSYYEKSENLERIYEHIAKSVVYRVLAEQKEFDDKYRRASEMVLSDWRNELRAIQELYELSNESLKVLNATAINDQTIKLDPTIPKAEYSSLIDVFTSSANFFDSTNSKKSDEFQEIAGDLLQLAKPITKLEVKQIV